MNPRFSTQSFALPTGVMARLVFFLVLGTLWPLGGRILASDMDASSSHPDAYVGLFEGNGVFLRLKADGAGYAGDLFFKRAGYVLTAAENEGVLRGRFRDASGGYDFSFRRQAEKWVFEAGTFRAELKPAKVADLADLYFFENGRIEFRTKGDDYRGSVELRGKRFDFDAKLVVGALEGTFQDGNDSFPFTMQMTGDNLVFKTGSFSAVAWPAGRSHKATILGKEAWVNSLGMPFVRVPGTQVSFCIWETRRQDFAEYRYARDPSQRKPDKHIARFPVTQVTWQEAVDFCEWLTERERAEGQLSANACYRLPTDQEWSYAVGIGSKEQDGTPEEKSGRVQGQFPWGREWIPPVNNPRTLSYPGLAYGRSRDEGCPPKDVGNYDEREFGAVDLSKSSTVSASTDPDQRELAMMPTPRFDDGFDSDARVGSFPPNELGLYDLGGNVWEWCQDWFNVDEKLRVARGGSYRTGTKERMLSSYRWGLPPSPNCTDVGFRCVLQMNPQENTGASRESGSKDSPF